MCIRDRCVSFYTRNHKKGQPLQGEVFFLQKPLLTTWHCCPTHTNLYRRRPADSKRLDNRWGFSTKKTETVTLNMNMSDHVKVNGMDIQQTSKFTYLGSIIKPEGVTKEDIHQSRLGKTRDMFKEMNIV